MTVNRAAKLLRRPARSDFRGARKSYALAYALIGLASVVVLVLLVANDAFDKLYHMSRTHEDWEVDELLWVFVVGAFALLGVLVIRRRQLAEEVLLREKAETAMRNMSRFDQITGVANRQMLVELLEQHILQARADRTHVALLVLDIDQFMAVNDLLGSAGGDSILRAVAGRLRQELGPDDVLSRLGADEFAVLHPMQSLEEMDRFVRLAEQIIATLSQPFASDKGAMSLTVSIGIAAFPRDAANERELLRVAEAAQLQAKAAGKGRYALFDPSLDAKQRERYELEGGLKEAIAKGQIFACYQPLFGLNKRVPVGVEALARWRHPERGILAPSAFIDLAEDAGLIEPLFEHMLRQVCAETIGWPDDLTVGVNISPHQLVQEKLAETVFAILAEYGYPPGRLAIEITETALLLDFEAARRTMTALKARGVRLSLDDFGTGFSTFTHLRQLPFDTIKIDKSFVQGLLEDPQRRKIVTSMIGLGKALGLSTVAEGVEREGEAEWLRANGCDMAQGFVFAHPMAPAEVLRLFAKFAPAPGAAAIAWHRASAP